MFTFLIKLLSLNGLGTCDEGIQLELLFGPLISWHRSYIEIDKEGHKEWEDEKSYSLELYSKYSKEHSMMMWSFFSISFQQKLFFLIHNKGDLLKKNKFCLCEDFTLFKYNNHNYNIIISIYFISVHISPEVLILILVDI